MKRKLREGDAVVHRIHEEELGIVLQVNENGSRALVRWGSQHLGFNGKLWEVTEPLRRISPLEALARQA